LDDELVVFGGPFSPVDKDNKVFNDPKEEYNPDDCAPMLLTEGTKRGDMAETKAVFPTAYLPLMHNGCCQSLINELCWVCLENHFDHERAWLIIQGMDQTPSFRIYNRQCSGLEELPQTEFAQTRCHVLAPITDHWDLAGGLSCWHKHGAVWLFTTASLEPAHQAKSLMGAGSTHTRDVDHGGCTTSMAGFVDLGMPPSVLARGSVQCDKTSACKHAHLQPPDRNDRVPGGPPVPIPFNLYGGLLHGTQVSLVTTSWLADHLTTPTRFTMVSTGGYLCMMERQHLVERGATNDKCYYADVTFLWEFCTMLVSPLKVETTFLSVFKLLALFKCFIRSVNIAIGLHVQLDLHIQF
jgi:hypothetical protein